ncbi:MAG: hypothetical protein ABIH46_02090 [Chloroflexota bacterium]
MRTTKIVAGIICLVAVVAAIAGLAWLLLRSSPLWLEIEHERASQAREERLTQEFLAEQLNLEGDNSLWRSAASNLTMMSRTLAMTHGAALAVIGASFMAFLLLLLLCFVMVMRRQT